MSNEQKDKVFSRLFSLWAAIAKMVVDGVRDPEKVAEALQAIVDGVAGVKVYLRELVNAVVGPTDGTKTFANSGFVIGYIHPDYKPTAGQPTPETRVTVCEMIEDGNFVEVLGSLGEARKRWQNEDQIVEFCQKHPGKLRKDGYATFFELEGGFVADVGVDDDGRLYAHLYHVSHDYVWSAEYRHRIVVPQL